MAALNFGRGKEADICLILEGTYPYISGGVSSWTHDLIKAQKDKSFQIFSIMPTKEEPTVHYPIPENVVGIETTFMQVLPKGGFGFGKQNALINELEEPLYELLTGNFEEQFPKVNELFTKYRSILGRRILVESKAVWAMILRLYEKLCPDTSYLDFFWSIMVLSRSIYSLLLPPLPKAKLYHSLSTGYSGMLLARAKLETNCPCLLTEHGLYTVERRIEIGVADWFGQPESLNLSFDYQKMTLRSYWLNAFLNTARLCYYKTDEIITLYEGNRDLQISFGARPDKITVIPNGVDMTRFAKLKRKATRENPTIALVGRTVPIKDVTTYIRACLHVKKQIPNIKAFVLGATDEAEEYYEDCLALVKELALEKTVFFPGTVKLQHFLPKIDLNILTSLSESQPLVVLETGAMGIPSVATKVGSCPELIYGKKDEEPKLGAGGIIIPLADAQAAASAIIRLLTDNEFYESCSFAIKERVARNYTLTEQNKRYTELYNKFLGGS